MPEGKRKWWIIPAVIILAAVLIVGVCWDAAAVYLAPKSVLTATLSNTFASLEQRFSGSPLLILGQGFSRDGKQSILLELNTNDKLLGETAYNMNIRTDGSACAVFAEGTVTTNGNILDLSLYMNREFAAITSGSLLQGSYYGITYDTFSEDIRRNQLLSFMLGEKTISQWEQSVASLEEQMNRSYTVPDVSESDITMAMVGVLALKAQVERDTLLVNGNELECFAVSFRAEGEEIEAACEYAGIELPFTVDETSVLTARFYIYEDLVVQVELTLTGSEEFDITLSLGDQPARNDLSLTASFSGADSAQWYKAVVSTDSDDSDYSETLRLFSTVGAVQEKTEIHYDYTAAIGDVTLQRDGREVQLLLSEAENGFRIETEDFEALMAVLAEREDDADSSAVLTVTKGAEFSAPQYKNFDSWSIEDLATLLGGIGSLFGLEIA